MGLVPVSKFWRRDAAKALPLVRDWTQQELAQFYRVEWALSQSGISVEIDRGMSDEGDPWFAFCRVGDAEVVIHIAREGETYILAGFLAGRVQRGRDFNELVERVLASHPVKSMDKRGHGNVVMHPATLLALLVSIAFLQSQESKAAAAGADAGSDAATAIKVVPQISQTSSSAASLLRPTATLVGSTSHFSATLEISQAMTVLRVASVLSQLPVEQSLTFALEQAASSADRGALAQRSHDLGTGLDLTAISSGDAQPARAAASMSSGPIAAQSGVDKLLEVVAKLWTIADVPQATKVGIGVDAAISFFAGKTAGFEEIVIDRDLSKADIQQIAKVIAGDAAAHASEVVARAGAEPAAAGGQVTLVHTSASSDTIAQTMVKLNVASQGEQVVQLGSATTPSKLYAVLSDIVAHAKSGTGLDAGTATVVPTGATVDIQPSATAVKLGDVIAKQFVDLQTTAHEASPVLPDTSKLYTTTVGQSVVKHDVLDDAAGVVVERAIAAFKEDVGKFSIAVTGQDVIFYNADAVINHSSKVVVELWQFKDGSSISLVGLSVEGHLPYSL